MYLYTRCDLDSRKCKKKVNVLHMQENCVNKQGFRKMLCNHKIATSWLSVDLYKFTKFLFHQSFFL